MGKKEKKVRIRDPNCESACARSAAGPMGGNPKQQHKRKRKKGKGESRNAAQEYNNKR